MRDTQFVEGENYHIFNRGVDKRSIFLDEKDLDRFYRSMFFFNTKDPVGSIFETELVKENMERLGHLAFKDPLVKFICYCLNPNHFHFGLTPVLDGGISEFMKRLSGGYTKYFNEKYKRTGSLFQGTYKSKHINTDSYLIHSSVYINLNNRVHNWDKGLEKFVKSSWDEYIGESPYQFCDKSIVLDQFKSLKSYEDYALESLKDIKRRKDAEKEFRELLID